MGMPNDKLTPMQTRFALLVAEGMKLVDAYGRAYPTQSLSRPAMKVEASRTAALPKVRKYIADLLAEQRKDVLLTRDKKRLILGEIALNKSEKAPSRIAAIHQDNLMTGDHKPVRVEGEITLHGIFATLLADTTGLPSPAEVKQLKQAQPVAAPRTRENEAPATTAMERAG